MKIFVFSDSHGVLAPMKDVIEKGKPDLVLHLGDNIRDGWWLAEMFPHIPHRFVRGNCDAFCTRGSLLKSSREEEIFDAGGRRILMTHGHRYGVKSGLGAIRKAGQKAGADIVLFGHTHVAHHEMVGDMHLFNPGSPSMAGRYTYGEILIADDVVQCAIVELPRKQKWFG